jgi:hypothetical protein
VSDELEPELIHRLKNLISIASGFCSLIVDECPPGDPRLDDLQQIQDALDQALSLMPELAARIK